MLGKHLGQHIVHPAQDPEDRMLKSSRKNPLAKRVQKNLTESTRMQKLRKDPVESKIAKGQQGPVGPSAAEGMANFGKLPNSTVVLCESQDQEAKRTRCDKT